MTSNHTLSETGTLILHYLNAFYDDVMRDPQVDANAADVMHNKRKEITAEICREFPLMCMAVTKPWLVKG